METIRELIAEEDPDVEVLELDESPGSGRGDNYTSMLYRLGVKGRRRSSNEIWEKSIIYKVLPESKERRDAYKSELLFTNEVVFYTKVWPALMELQSAGRRVFDGVAKVYIAKPDLIAMEDLKAKGFKMADRTKGLQVDKLKAVLKALAGFHALSLTLRDLRYIIIIFPTRSHRLNSNTNYNEFRLRLNIKGQKLLRGYQAVPIPGNR